MYFPAEPESVAGHLLVVPARHVCDAAEDPEVTGQVFAAAARIAARIGAPCNLATNVGSEAGQKIGHLHVHLLPRTGGGALEVPRGEVMNTAGLRDLSSPMWRRWEWYRNLWIRWWAWQDRKSPGVTACEHGQVAHWDNLDGGWWHRGDYSPCDEQARRWVRSAHEEAQAARRRAP